MKWAFKAARVNKRDGEFLLVYVIEAGDYVKVGIAADLKTRLAVCQTHCPLSCRVVFCSEKILRPRARELEILCQEHLIGNHVHGEWFREKSETAVDFLKSLLGADIKKDPVQLRLVA